MKTVDILNIYRILSSSKLTGLDTTSAMTILNNMDMLEAVKDSYDNRMNKALDNFKPKDYDEIERAAQLHNEAINSKSNKYLLSPDEKMKNLAILGDYNRDVANVKKTIEKEEVEINFEKLSKEGFESFYKANYEMSVQDLQIMKRVLV